ncbi:MAG: nuclear transport factor 2 family protein [Gemmatimonadaceae bacterium]|nr:nuclear transport factor 2 family protein [Gemmatimonadaceae bacterium]
MKRILFALVAATLSVAPRVAAQQADVMAAVNRFGEAFNKGDTKAVNAACASDAIIIDEFPPYTWHGPATCGKWMDAYAAEATKNKITDGQVTLGKPLHVDVTADRAYVVLPSRYVYKKAGKPVAENESFITISLQKTAGAWTIVGWAWTKR